MDRGTLHDLVAAAACVHAERTAVTYDSGSGSVSLFYSDVVTLVSELSQTLRDNCCLRNDVIGLCCLEDLFTPVWILGILQFPAAYAPLDPDAPGLLSARVINQCGLKYCAVQSDLLKKFQAVLHKHMTVDICVVLPKYKLTLVEVKPLHINVNNQTTQQNRVQKTDGASDAMLGDWAYVLHTSGTTGLPKIVRVPHKCIVPNIIDLRSLFQMNTDDVIFLASPLTFDPSVVEIFLALSSGAQLLVVPTVIKKIPHRLAQVLFGKHRTTVLQVTPTLIGRFGHHILKEEVLSSGSSLRVLALGGEACPSPALLKSWRHIANKTHIYNIYGVTEVSCWASCYKIPETLLQECSSVPSHVPLGTPLMDTVLEVRDERGCVVKEGQGQMFIGGLDRVCLLDGEDTVVPGTMRATGDWVDVNGGQLYYLGRRDRLIKRHGKQVNLDSLQQVILTVPEVDACAVCLYERFRLLAFVVASTSSDQKSATALAEHHKEAASSVELDLDETDSADGELRRLIVNQLSQLLPSYSIPDSLVLISALPLSRHGKVDMDALMKIYQRRRHLESDSSLGDVINTKQTIQRLWQETLGLAEHAAVEDESRFLLSGGDSLKALCLHEDILTVVGVTSPQLLEIILDGTFSDIVHHVAAVILKQPLEIRSESNKRHAEASSAGLTKRERKDWTATEQLTEEEEDSFRRRVVKVLRRAGEMIEMNFQNAEMSKAPSLSRNLGSDQKESCALALGLSWSSDTGRCVDASPVILVQGGTDLRSAGARTSVIIGSHSHRVQALDLDTGSLLWERVLGNRIESSAAVSECGSLVVIGCYDGCVYFLCAASGETRWSFKTGDAVKSCPTVDPLTGLVIVGSHDGHVYSLNPKDQQCVWRRHCGGGAVFSSPYLHPSHRRLYVASLGGNLLCLNPDSGEVLWSYSGEVPFFSSPNGCSGHVVIGSVDGNICCFSYTGKPLWQFLTKGPVFSSPCVTPNQQRVLCGSHDGYLYCLNSTDGSLVWTFHTSGKVYSSPCVFSGSTLGRKGILVGLASTDGTIWILDGQDGKLLGSTTLPGELFSSPVVWEHSLVIGCRNDYVYCLKMTMKEKT
ncbi:beta-alanine-activating enzyme [Thalassophryne amazonica]|uniref:beta-alanine-activating enzyme n=1 Tax=Thalassophryne amazonica TaxID=390379 RepID=UPI001471B8CC|nr:beta-alanine-activating enzyme [Thalassophryne amazonica]